MFSFIKRILNNFFIISQNDPEDQRTKKILNILLFAIEFIDSCLILVYLIFLIIGNPSGIIQTIYLLILFSITFIAILIIFLINNFLSKRLANITFLIFLTVITVITDTPYEVVLGRSLLVLSLPIIIAGLLIKPYASFIASFCIILLNLLICINEGFIPEIISLTVYVLIAFISWFFAINFKELIEKYHKAYTQESFYRDLFAHDTSNILQNILMALEILEQELKTSGELTERESLKSIKVQIDRGANLIRNVRKFGIFSETETFLKKVDFKKVLEEAIENIKSRTERKEINVQIETLKQNTFVMANKFLLDIFENILINSVIHNDNSIVEIFIRISNIQEERKPFLKAEFIDNGVGIPDSIKQNIFKREIDGDKSLIGLGLGLSLVKRILDQYKAKIWVENKIPEDYTKGSNFILIFPEVY